MRNFLGLTKAVVSGVVTNAVFEVSFETSSASATVGIVSSKPCVTVPLTSSVVHSIENVFSIYSKSLTLFRISKHRDSSLFLEVAYYFITLRTVN